MSEGKIRYCHTSDGVAIAYAVVGDGPPLLYARRFLAPAVDDELTYSFSAWGPLARVRSVVLWDMRGSGLSEAAPDSTFDDWLRDMEAVEDAVGAEHIDVGGELTPSQFAIAFSVRHPEKVEKMVLWNPTPSGFSPRSRHPKWLRDLAVTDWDSFADVSSLRMYGWARAAAAARFADRLRLHFTPERYQRTMDAIELIEDNQATAVLAPTLIIVDQNFLLERGDDASFPQRQDFMRTLAAEIPSAELAIVKAGDLTEAGRVAIRFLEPNASVTVGANLPLSDGGTAVILFADIVDSTGLTERLGDEAFRGRARELDAMLRKIIRDAGGTAIDGKLLGDGVLGTFRAAAQAIAASLACANAGEEQSLPLHIGLHAGDVIREDNNVFGGAVNIASRISGLSAPGEVLVSDVVRALARTSAAVIFDDRGERVLKGVTEPQHLFAVRPNS